MNKENNEGDQVSSQHLYHGRISSPERDESSTVTPQSRDESGSGCLYPRTQKKIQAATEGIPPWQRDQAAQTELRDTASDVYKQFTSAIEARESNQRLPNANSVVVVKEEEDGQEKWHAQISFDRHRRVLMSALQCHEGLSPTISSVSLKHEEVMAMVGTESRRVFLELGIGVRSLGKLIIRLIDEGNYTSNFLHLCIGDKGNSYIGSKIRKASSFGHSSEFITGDYDLKDDTGGQAVVLGVDWKEEWQRMIYKSSSCFGGLVKAWRNSESQASQFTITLSSMDQFPGPIFGRVEEGLNILFNASLKYCDITDVEVIDCGVILQHRMESLPWWEEGPDQSSSSFQSKDDGLASPWLWSGLGGSLTEDDLEEILYGLPSFLPK